MIIATHFIDIYIYTYIIIYYHLIKQHISIISMWNLEKLEKIVQSTQNLELVMEKSKSSNKK